MTNEKYSYKDFTGKKFLDIDPAEFSGTTIIGSCFYQEGTPDTEVFPEIKDVEFLRCNLDNVFIPTENTVGVCSCKRKIIQREVIVKGKKGMVDVDEDAKNIELDGKTFLWG